jgi:hypothetical protein
MRPFSIITSYEPPAGLGDGGRRLLRCSRNGANRDRQDGGDDSNASRKGKVCEGHARVRPDLGLLVPKTARRGLNGGAAFPIYWPIQARAHKRLQREMAANCGFPAIRAVEKFFDLAC